MDDLVEQTRKYMEEEPDTEQELLTEIISLRTGVITAFLAKTKQYANKIDSEVRRTKSDASAYKRSSTPEDEKKNLGDTLDGLANLFYLLRKMQMYDALTSASTGIGIDKSTKILQKMEKQKGRR